MAGTPSVLGVFGSFRECPRVTGSRVQRLDQKRLLPDPSQLSMPPAFGAVWREEML
jgi:hypothetical protein